MATDSFTVHLLSISCGAAVYSTCGGRIGVSSCLTSLLTNNSAFATPGAVLGNTPAEHAPLHTGFTTAPNWRLPRSHYGPKVTGCQHSQPPLFNTRWWMT